MSGSDREIDRINALRSYLAKHYRSSLDVKELKVLDDFIMIKIKEIKITKGIDYHCVENEHDKCASQPYCSCKCHVIKYHGISFTFETDEGSSGISTYCGLENDVNDIDKGDLENVRSQFLQDIVTFDNSLVNCDVCLDEISKETSEEDSD